MDIKTMLGERIANARAVKGFSQEQLAQRIGVKKSTIANWEEERSKPRGTRLNQVAGVLDVPLGWILAGAENPPEIGNNVADDSISIGMKLQQAETLVSQLSALLGEIRVQIHK